MPDETPKSAYELAMERLRQQDAEKGTIEKPLSDQQKQAIAEARRICEAKLAELEILHRSKVAGVADPEALKALQQEYQRDIQRATDERERKIAKIRKKS